MDYVIVLSIIFVFGWFCGKVLSRMYKIFTILFCLWLMPLVYQYRTFRGLLCAVALIFGFAVGYKLLPKFTTILSEMRISLELFFYKLKESKRKRKLVKPNPLNQNSFYSDDSKHRDQNKRHYRQNKKRYKQNQDKANELNQKEQELRQQAEEIRRQKQQAEEEIRQARQQAQQQQQQARQQAEKQRQQNSVKMPNTLHEAFETLETKPGLTKAEYKKIYYALSMRYDPNKVNHLGEKLIKLANEEMKAINRAWEIINNTL